MYPTGASAGSGSQPKTNKNVQGMFAGCVCRLQYAGKYCEVFVRDPLLAVAAEDLSVVLWISMVA